MKHTISNPTLIIDDQWLRANDACSDGYKAHRQQFPNGATHAETRDWITSIDRDDWANWLMWKIGPDTVTAGEYGTATAGHHGTATAGYKGTATAGYGGTATAGYGGTATAGHHGTAAAGEYGTATAGEYGTATAGEGGCICILWFHDARYKRRCAEVGGGGLKPNVPYQLNDKGEFVEA